MRTHNVSVTQLHAALQRMQVAVGVLLLATAFLLIQRFVIPGELQAEQSKEGNGNYTFSADSILRVRGLVVVDENGTDRVWIGAPLPDPPLFGKRISRGGKYAGIILMDATGTERSGYATTDEGQVMITLDEVGRMVANFMAQPAGGVRMNITDEYDNGLRFGSSKDGPFLQFIRNGKLIDSYPRSTP